MTTAYAESLAPELVKQYRMEGWVKVKNALALSDIEIIRCATERASEVIASDRLDLAKCGTTDVKRPTEYLQTARRMFRNETDLRLHFPELDSVVARVAKIVAALTGFSDVRVLQDQTFTKPAAAEGGLPTSWHQDYSYYPLDRRGLLSCWIPLQAVTPETGSLRFVPRSHRLGPLGRIIGEVEDDLDVILTPEDKSIVGAPACVPLAVGDMTVHNGLTLHGAAANHSDRPRVAWTILFIPGETRYTGAPCGHKRLNNAGLDLLGRFDDASFRIKS